VKRVWATFKHLLSADANHGSRVRASPVVMTLGVDLAEVDREALPAGISSEITYRMPDQSLVIFGSQIHEYGEQYTSKVAIYDHQTRSLRLIDPNRSMFTDTGFIDCAVPIDEDGQFVAATIAVARGFTEHVVPNEMKPGFSRGAAMEFFTLM
jgi:hypothetical protein